MTTNLLHNAIVHNLPEHGTVQVSTAKGPESVMLTVENTGDKLAPQLVSTLTATVRARRQTHGVVTIQGSASAWPSSRASPRHTTEPSPSPPGPLGPSASPPNYPMRLPVRAALSRLG